VGTCLAAALVVTSAAAGAAQRVQRTRGGGFARELQGWAEKVAKKQADREKRDALQGISKPPSAAAESASSTGGGDAATEQGAKGSSPSAPPPGGDTSDVIPQTLGALTAGELVLAIRTVGGTAAFSLAFAATGNLAASLAGSLGSAAVFALCSRYRLKLFREVSLFSGCVCVWGGRLGSRWRVGGSVKRPLVGSLAPS